MLYNNKEDIIAWLKRYHIDKYRIEGDGTVHVGGDVLLDNQNLDAIRVQFGRIKGRFNCSKNQLTSLEGCPQNVEGSFDCSNNNLISLEFCPRFIGGMFFYDAMENLEHFPQYVSSSIFALSGDKNPLQCYSYRSLLTIHLEHKKKALLAMKLQEELAHQKNNSYSIKKI